MPPFEELESAYGPPTQCEEPSDAAVQAHEGTLPAEIVDHWREVGWCAYGDGLVWFTNPQQFDGILEDWVDECTDAPVFLRTAFAHLYYWCNGQVHSLDVQRGGVSQVTDNLELFSTLLVDEDIQEQILRRSLFEEVKERLGSPGRDECYAFVPALALGGPGTADSVQKVKIREQLGILAQLVGG
jgi:hypothetical protein